MPALSNKERYVYNYTITKTYLYNFDPLKPHFYIVKLGFTGVYMLLIFLLKNIVGTRSNRLGDAVRTSTTIYVLSRNMKNISIFCLKTSSFWW